MQTCLQISQNNPFILSPWQKTQAFKYWSVKLLCHICMFCSSCQATWSLGLKAISLLELEELSDSEPLTRPTLVQVELQTITKHLCFPHLDYNMLQLIFCVQEEELQHTWVTHTSPRRNKIKQQPTVTGPLIFFISLGNKSWIVVVIVSSEGNKMISQLICQLN